MMRQLKITRDTAVKARTTAMNTLKQIVVNAPPHLREALHALTDHGLLTRCAGLRPGPPRHAHPQPPSIPSGRSPAAGWLSPRRLRYTTSTSRASRPRQSPTLREGFGVGAHSAAELLIIFGDNPDRIRSEAAFAKICGAVSDPGLVRDDHRPAPPQSRRPPTRQRRPLSSRHRPHAVPSADR